MSDQLIDIQYDLNNTSDISRELSIGTILILRNVQPIKEFRGHLIDLSCGYGDARETKQELLQFYESGKLPSLPTIFALRCGMQLVIKSRLLSQYLAPFIEKIGFEASVLLDGGISRLVFPNGLINELRESGQYDPVDFLRDRADGPTETFMPVEHSNIVHRDFNRVHYQLQCNIWFPLHDIAHDERLRIWAEQYRNSVSDIDAASDIVDCLGCPVEYKLNFGDAIIFHGEHIHASPSKAHGVADYRRHTFDLRVATSCGNNNKGYRDNFFNLNNFIAAGNYSSPSVVDDTRCNYMERFLEKMDAANYYLWVLENRNDLTKKDIEDIMEIFLRLPFAEDRYLILLDKALSMGMFEAAKKVAEQITALSPHFFWLLRCGEIVEKYGLDDIANALFSHCEEVLSHHVPKSFMPVTYKNGSNELLVEDARRIVREKLHESNRK